MASDDRNVDLINRDPNDMNAHIKVIMFQPLFYFFLF